jgi:hypothetical protein
MTCSRGVRGPAGAIVGAKSSAVAGAATAGAGATLVIKLETKGRDTVASRPHCLRVMAVLTLSCELAWTRILRGAFSLGGSLWSDRDRANMF